MGPGAGTDTGPSLRVDGSTGRRAIQWARLALALGVAAAAVVATGAASALLTGWTGLPVGDIAGESVWLAATLCGLGVGAVLLRRAPANPVSASFALMMGATSTATLLDHLSLVGSDRGAPTAVVVALVWLSQTLVLAATAAAVHLVATFPDGVLERWWERAVVHLGVVAVLVPTVLLVVNPVLTTAWWDERPDVASPLHLPALAVEPDTASVLLDLGNGVILLAAVALVARYVRSGPHRRTRMRWVLLPIVLTAVGTVSTTLLQPPAPVVAVFFLVIQVLVYLSVALALLQPHGLDPDHVLRRSLVYGVLWLAITVVWVLAAAVVGVTAGRASVGWAVAVTMLAAAVFQPARRWLEGLADRWVFGRRTDPTGVIAQLGATLATTYDTEAVLPQMAETLREGLHLEWAEVTLQAHAVGDEDPGSLHRAHDPEAALVVPIVLDGEALGLVRCGPRRSGPLTTDEVDLVTAFAHQAALAVRNVRLTRQLGDHAAELAASRTRLVRAQEAERRRIERNIHDGVQQDLVALISHAGRAQRMLGQAPSAAGRELTTVQEGLRRVLADLRELARGIHPSLLTDRGLLVAVEALAARSPVPTVVRADPSLREHRLSGDVEATAYFTVAEAVANTLKHADASHLKVSLARRNGSLLVEVVDDGRGMEPNADALATVAERVAAMGGRLTVTSSPGHGTTVLTRLDVDGGMS